ncbi:hypothetical protein KCJ70_001204 [Salmonella enterica]|nr:hypothetical protein [Salmonella enterica]
MKKNLLGFTLASLLFTTGSAVAAEYKIDKEGQHAFVNFRIQHLGYVGGQSILDSDRVVWKFPQALTGAG